VNSNSSNANDFSIHFVVSVFCRSSESLIPQLGTQLPTHPKIIFTHFYKATHSNRSMFARSDGWRNLRRRITHAPPAAQGGRLTRFGSLQAVKCGLCRVRKSVDDDTHSQQGACLVIHRRSCMSSLISRRCCCCCCCCYYLCCVPSTFSPSHPLHHPTPSLTMLTRSFPINLVSWPINMALSPTSSFSSPPLIQILSGKPN
jgi:hypothetical protein